MGFDNAAIAAIGETEKSRPSETNDQPFHDLEEYLWVAAQETLGGTGLSIADVDGLGLARPSIETQYRFPLMIADTLGLSDLKWITATDHCGGQAVPLLAQAAMAVDAGVAETVLCLGADTPKVPDRGEGEVFPRDPRGLQRNYKDPFGVQGTNAEIAHVQNRHAERYGTTPEQLGHLYVTQRRHAAANPLAYFDEPVDLEGYLESAPIADPIRLFDCVIPVNAGFGALVTTPERAQELTDTPVSVAGVGHNHNPAVPEDRRLTATGMGPAADRALDQADLDPTAADFYQLYDDYPIVLAIEMEEIGLCEPDDIGRFLEETDFGIEGDVPLNTGGGQLCAGQAGVAGGFLQVVEGVRQLRGEGGDRQVPDAGCGLVTGVGGVSANYDGVLSANSAMVLRAEVSA
jgi:acetyl-CoA acetyltransferase